MKKRILFFSALLSSGLCLAQDMGTDSIPKNKKGNEILPKKGDIGLGFNAIPIIDMFLTSFQPGATGAGSIVQSTSNNQIVGKYFLDARTAIRVRFGINNIAGTATNFLQDAAAMNSASQGTADDIAAASLLTVEDKLTFRKTNMLLSLGLEKRRGYRRLQGFYGAEFGVGKTGSIERVTYGNAFSDQFPTYYTSDFNTMATATVNPTDPGRSARELETKYQGGFRFGLRGFIGIEYFIFTKISIGAEYGWGWSIATRGAATQSREVYVNGQNGPSVITEEVNSDSKASNRGFSVDNNNGAIFSMNNTLNGNTALSGGAGALTLMFHF